MPLLRAENGYKSAVIGHCFVICKFFVNFENSAFFEVRYPSPQCELYFIIPQYLACVCNSSFVHNCNIFPEQSVSSYRKFLAIFCIISAYYKLVTKIRRIVTISPQALFSPQIPALSQLYIYFAQNVKLFFRNKLLTFCILTKQK